MTLTFRVFLKRLLYAAMVTIAVILAIITAYYLDYRSQQTDLQGTIDFYERFIHADDFLAQDDIDTSDSGLFRSFVYAMRYHVNATAEDPALQLDSLLRLNRDYSTVFGEVRKTIKNDPELLYALLFDKARTSALIAAKQEKQARLAASFNSYPEWRLALTVFQWTSIVWFVVSWMLEGKFSIFFFPLRAWWLYGYLALAFPASLVLVASTLVVEMTIFAGKAIGAEKKKIGSAYENLKRRFRREASYDEMCANIRAAREKQRKNWVGIFRARRIDLRIRQENSWLETTKNDLVEIGRKLKELQTSYFEGRAKIRALERLSAAEDLMGKEFDELYENPHVKALEIQEKERVLVVHTGIFSSRLGLVGPFRVEIAVSGTKGIRVHPGAEFTRAHPSGGGGAMHGGGFCFGNTNKLITDLINELRFAEAVGVAFQAFQGS